MSYTWQHRIYRTLRRLSPIVLNDGAATANSANDPSEILKKYADKLKRLTGATTSHHVDYERIAASDAYAAARAMAASLPGVDLHALQSDAEKKAFWIDLYNFLVIDAVIQLGIKASITEFRGFFDRIGYTIGGMFFSAHDIEQGILRANAGHPAVPGPQFPPNSDRAKHIVTELDFRIHFALNCAAESCPPVGFYDADAVDSQLDLAARNFLNSSEVTVNLQKREATLPKILQWYAPDFGASSLVTLGYGDASPILRSIAPFMVDNVIRGLLENEAESVTVRFKDYDWSLNQDLQQL